MGGKREKSLESALGDLELRVGQVEVKGRGWIPKMLQGA